MGYDGDRGGGGGGRGDDDDYEKFIEMIWLMGKKYFRKVWFFLKWSLPDGLVSLQMFFF